MSLSANINEGALLTYSIDMRDNFVIDPLIGKRQQLLLATQLCRMVLKVSVVKSSPTALHNITAMENPLIHNALQVNNVIIAGSDENEF